MLDDLLGAYCSTSIRSALLDRLQWGVMLTQRLETCSTTLSERQERNAQPAYSGAQCSTLKGRRPARRPTRSALLNECMERNARQTSKERYAQHHGWRPALPSPWSAMLNEFDRNAKLNHLVAERNALR